MVGYYFLNFRFALVARVFKIDYLCACLQGKGCAADDVVFEVLRYPGVSLSGIFNECSV